MYEPDLSMRGARSMGSIGNARPEADIDIAALAGVLWRGRWVILLTTLAALVLAAVYVIVAPQRWRSEVVFVQTDSKSMQGALGQLGGLASLAGVDLGAASGGSSQVAMAVLRSKEFAREFIQDNGLAPILLADKWDSVQKQWKERNPAKQPDVRDAVDYFDRKVRSVSEDKKTGVVTLSITWSNAEEAAKWANALVERVNAKLRTRAQVEAERNIEFLRGEIAASSVNVLQQSLSKVLESEMQKLLLTKGNEEYAFKVVDSATPARKRAWPPKVLILLGSALASLVLSSVFVLARSALKTERSPLGI
jgi:uncharacterized protein involved in exopolysaccharide biosynthesis